MNPLIGKTIERYRILAEIGSGGMAVVYKAVDTHLDAPVALKVIQPGIRQDDRFLKRFEREARTLARMSHLNIVRTIDYGVWNGSPYLVMSYIGGGTLRDRLTGPILAHQAAQILIPIAMALHAAHQQGIIHRDVKPSNILLTEHGDPLLSDFGVARLADGNEHTQLTTTGVGVGTPDYMSPEQWEGQAGPASDQYALAVVFYEMVTGQRPFAAPTPAAVMRRHLIEPLTPARQLLPGLPTEVDDILRRALAKHPEERYPDIATFAAALREIPGGKATPPAPHQAFERTPTDPVIPTGDTTFGPISPANPPLPPQAMRTVSQALAGSRPRPGKSPGWQVPALAGLGLLTILTLGLLLSQKLGGQGQPTQPAGESRNAYTATQAPSAPLFDGTQAAAQTIEVLMSQVPDATVQSQATVEAILTPAAAQAYTATAAALPTASTAPGPDSLPAPTTAAYYKLGQEVLSANNLQRIELLSRMQAWVVLNTVAFSPDGHILAAGTDTHTVQVYDVGNGTLLTELRGHTGRVTDVEFSPDGATLASASDDKTVRYWQVGDWQEINRLELKNKVTFLRFLPDGDTLAVGDEHNGYLVNWRAQAVTTSFSLDRTLYPKLVVYQPGDPEFWTGTWPVEVQDVSNDGMLWLLTRQLADLKEQTWIALDYMNQDAAFSNDEQHILVSEGVLNVRTRQNLGNRWFRGTANFIDRTRDGSFVVSSSYSNIFFEPYGEDTQYTFFEKKEHPAQVMDINFSPDGKMVASCDYGGTIIIWGVP